MKGTSPKGNSGTGSHAGKHAKKRSFIPTTKLNEDLVNIYFMKLCGQDILHTIYHNKVYFSWEQVLKVAGVSINKGYSKIDEVLNLNNLSRVHEVFLIRRKKRAWILKHALLTILGDGKFYSKAKNRFVKEALQKVTVDSITVTMRNVE